MNVREAFTSDLKAELERRRRILAAAESGSTRELEQGIRELELELRRRARYGGESAGRRMDDAIAAVINADAAAIAHELDGRAPMTGARHYFTIQTRDGYHGTYATEHEAKHERRRLFGIRALAHPVVRVIGTPRKPRPDARP